MRSADLHFVFGKKEEVVGEVIIYDENDNVIYDTVFREERDFFRKLATVLSETYYFVKIEEKNNSIRMEFKVKPEKTNGILGGVEEEIVEEPWIINNGAVF